jgi:hypothetical protein
MDPGLLGSLNTDKGVDVIAPTPSSDGHLRLVVDQVFFQDRHLELERPIIILVVDEKHADELLTNIHFGRIVLFGTRYDAQFLIAKDLFEISVELPDFLNVHRASPIQ